MTEPFGVAVYLAFCRQHGSSSVLKPIGHGAALITFSIFAEPRFYMQSNPNISLGNFQYNDTCTFGMRNVIHTILECPGKTIDSRAIAQPLVMLEYHHIVYFHHDITTPCLVSLKVDNM